MRDFTVIGPSAVTGVSDTPSRRAIFTCRPTTADEEAPCADEIVKRLATQAFRGPVTARRPQGRDGVLRAGPQEGRLRERRSGWRCRRSWPARASCSGFEKPSPARRVASSARAQARTASAIIDLASRLSFFLWGTVPDAELIKVAAQGTLRTPLVLEKQVRRMLADPRAEALATRFARQWLRLQDLDKIDSRLPAVSAITTTRSRTRCKRETELFFDSLVREDRSVLDLLTADYSFVNERVAQALRHSERDRATVPPRAVARTSPRHARPGQHPGAHVELRSHVAGAARQVGHGSAARHRRRRRRRPTCRRSTRPSRPATASCCPCASGWKNTARTRRARRVIG